MCASRTEQEVGVCLYCFSLIMFEWQEKVCLDYYFGQRNLQLTEKIALFIFGFYRQVLQVQTIRLFHFLILNCI